MKQYFLILLTFSFLWPALIMAQGRELEPEVDAAAAIGSILGGNDNTVTSVRVIADAEETLSVQVEFDGFDDQEYTIHGAVLNRIKRPLKEVSVEPQMLPKDGSMVELTFKFDKRSGHYTGSHLESHFVSLSISKNDAILSKLDLGGENLFGETYLYKLNKKWRVKGSESMVIQVKLTPYKSAATITP